MWVSFQVMNYQEQIRVNEQLLKYIASFNMQGGRFYDQYKDVTIDTCIITLCYMGGTLTTPVGVLTSSVPRS